MDTMTETTKQIDTEKKDEKMYAIACRVSNGETGSNYIYCLEENKFYVYENGYWKLIHEFELLFHISKKIQINHFTITRKKQIIDNLKILTFKRLDNLNNFHGLNLNNYMIEPLTGSVIKHDQKYLSTIRLNYNYEFKSPCNLWIKTLNEIFENDKEKINILQEYIGYSLTREISYEKSLLLLGESRSGKSTILETVSKILGEENTSSVALEYLSNPQYTPMLINKLVNIDFDVASNCEKFEANFKIITSGEPVSVNQKFIATFKFRPFCKLIMAANKFPRITDHSSAFYKRLMILPCNRIFEPEEQDTNLKFKLTEELPGILNWAIEGLHKLKARGRFEINKKFMVDAIEELREESNPVDIFFKENIVIDVNERCEVDKQELYEKYAQWCKDNGNAPMAKNKFGTIVYGKYSKFTPKDVKSFTGSYRRVWKNIRYIDKPLPEELQWKS